MLRFFRSLRQRLLAENRVSRYLLYAIGEIVLVVIGILIALQVNTWNEESQEAKSIKLQLSNLLYNMKDDRKVLHEQINYHAFRVHASYYLFNQFDQSASIMPYAEAGTIPELAEGGLYGGPIPDSLDRAFVVKAFSWLIRFNPGRPNMNAMDEFKNTGLFAKFGNQDLKNDIQYYYARFNWVFPDRDSGESSMTTQLRNSLISRGYSDLDLANLQNPAKEVLSDPTTRALIKNIIDESTFRSNMALEISEYLDQLILKIESEIER